MLPPRLLRGEESNRLGSVIRLGVVSAVRRIAGCGFLPQTVFVVYLSIPWEVDRVQVAFCLLETLRFSGFILLFFLQHWLG